MKYYIWTIGCQMNTADSRRLAAALDNLGYEPTDLPERADVIVLNTCVVRQQAEDKARGRASSLKSLKSRRPETIIVLMGCLVGVHDPAPLREQLPWIDLFLPPSDHEPLLELLNERGLGGEQEAALQAACHYGVDERYLLPAAERDRLVAAYVPVVLGCSHGCAYCVIPSRRGPERSRPGEEILVEARALADQGVKEITLLGQIVDRYGYDLATTRDSSSQTPLAGLLRRLNEIDGLERIRFLTSHPLWMNEDVLQAVAELPKVCEHIEVPVQAGDDEVLARMRRGYTAGEYRRLVERIRAVIPGVSIASDVIVGFPGETEAQFRRTYDLLAELWLDKVHIARYSSRPRTLAERRYVDDVPEQEKERRRKMLDYLQTGIAEGINAVLLGQIVEVLVEGRQKARPKRGRKGRWWGRTRTNKLVYFEDERMRHGELVPVRITWAGPWSLIGEPTD